MQKQQNKVTWNIFKRVFGNNPALIWNNDSLISDIKQEYQKRWNRTWDNIEITNEEDDEQFVNFDYEFFENHDIDAFHELNLDSVSDTETYIKVNKDSYDNYLKDALNWYLNKYNIPNSQVKFISSKSDYQTKHIDTLKAIKDNEIDLIFNGTLYDVSGDFDYVAPFFIYHKSLNKLVLLSYTARCKYEMYYKHFYIYQIFKTNNININDMSVLIINPWDRIHRKVQKGKINFYESFAADVTKSIRKISKDNPSTYQKQMFEALVRTGDINLKLGFNHNENSHLEFINIIKRNGISFSQKTADILHSTDEKLFIIENLSKEITIEFRSFKIYKKIIEKAFNEFNNKSNFDAIYKFLSIEKDKKIESVKSWLNNTLNYQTNSQKIWIDEWNFINKEQKIALYKLFIGPNFDEISFSFFSKKEKENLVEFTRKIELYNKNINFFNLDALTKILPLHQKDARICWYDYEGFSDLYPPLNNIAPYNQLVNQVSVIITKNGIEEKVENIVIDTKDLTIYNLVDLIDVIYSNKADWFVVYNKNYENARNKEIKDLVTENYLNNKEFEQYIDQKYKSIHYFAGMVDWINNHTIDLADCFKNSKQEKKNYEKITAFYEDGNNIKTTKVDKDFIKENIITTKKLIHINFLKYYFSIKKIEKYITHMNFDLKNKITPYSELVIQKGTMAMEAAILRYLGATNDAVWQNNIVPNLKKYCENDVRAMMMVYDFIMFLFSKAYDNLSEFEYQLKMVENMEYTVIGGKLSVATKR
ncbi:UU173 family protein [Mycoplasma sp. 4013]